ncbi:glycosyltransferase family 4 protein [Thermococcus sp. LS2]|uniref:glycosyltransferase family 4 protein n=1 Tax=Thermococcus sp. LS2 TaxID=1638260 RepID=UPI00143B7C87|nr:glycosyltransferase family 4 protein [Thermococcus sp. LS2]NJE12883.1 glycosyltransferase family 1 protein [Thermococcus sp. LS2]
MKVVLITRHFLPVKGGIENHCYNLARELSKRGISVEIHTSRDTLTKRNMLPEFEKMGDIPVYRHSHLWKLVPLDNIDIIHLHNFDLSNILLLARLFLKAHIKKQKIPKVILTPHGGYTPRWEEYSPTKKSIKKFLHKTLGKFFLDHIVDRVIAVSIWERKQLIKEGIDEDKITFIPNGVEDLAYTLPPQKAKIPHLTHRPYVLFLGRISHIKNIHLAIKCISKIHGVDFLIAGPVHEVKYYNYLKELITDLNMEDRIHFIGSVEGKNKYALIDSSIALIIVSFFESESIVTKEAMARGKPVIVSNRTALPYLVTYHKSGLVINNESECIEAIKTLYYNRKLAKKIGKINKKISKGWQWEIIAERILKIYNDKR